MDYETVREFLEPSIARPSKQHPAERKAIRKLSGSEYGFRFLCDQFMIGDNDNGAR